MDERMPLTIDNFIAIIEQYEKDNSNSSPENIVDALLYRYQTSGVIFDPNSKLENQWTVSQYRENNKQKLDWKLLKLSVTVPDDTFLPREECSIHMMLSHSTDYYPHAGVDYIWENNYFKRRKKRSVASSYSYPDIPEESERADHPVEFGVIQTSAGPISGGLLMAGILSSATTKSYTVQNLIDSDDVSKLPSEMLTKTIQPLYGTTISGVLAKAALLSSDEETFEIGPIGMFGNCSACPRTYSLEENDVYHLTRAELFGALDGFIIGNFLQKKASSQSVTLSEIIRMYYSDHGLYSSDLRACNRQNIYTKYRSGVSTTIRDQALNYMYAYQQYFPDVTSLIEQNSNSPEVIVGKFEDLLNEVTKTADSFMTSYSYDDPGYYPCPTETDDYKYETQVDLIVVYTPTGSSDNVEKQLEVIGLTARRIGVGYYRSRLAVLNGKTENWITPMTNHSNIADWVCNYTTSQDYSTSTTQDFEEVLNKLTNFYSNYTSYMKADLDLTGRNSQVVLWNLPTSFDGDDDVMLRAWNNFNLTYPEVTFIFVGSKTTSALSFLGDQSKNVILISPLPADNPIEISTDIVDEIRKAPRMFYYAACDTLVSEYSKYNEGSHVFSAFVTPNFTTIIKIPPQNFHFSETLKLTMDGDNLRVCLSRTNSQPSEDDNLYCDDSSFDYEFSELCDRNVSECNPIYISVTGNSDTISSSCTDDYCIYPYQTEFEMTHDGMICSSCLPSPTLLLFFITTIVIILGI